MVVDYKRSLLTLSLLTGTFMAAVAQPGRPAGAPPTPPAPPSAADPQLDALLARWEADMGRTQSLVVDFHCSRTYTGGIQKDFVGFLRCMRLPDGNYGAIMQQSKRENPNHVVEQYLCTGTKVYNISPDDKTVYIHALPARQLGQAPDEGALPFLFGMRGETARKRYQMSIKEPEDPAGRPWYTYVHIVPNFPRDLQDFQKARLTIMKKDSPAIPEGLPRQVHWIEPNNNKSTWDIQRVQRNVPGLLKASDFAPPTFDRSWKVETVPAVAGPGGGASRPNVIRPQDK